MMAFSANEAAFEGFRIVRREPGTIVIWGVLHLVLGLASVFLIVPFMGPIMQLAQTQPGAPKLNAAQSLALLANAARLYALILPLYLAVAAVYTCAVYRAVLRPTDKGFGRLRLGADELRMVVVWIALGLILMVSTIVLVVIAVLAAGMIAAATGGKGAGATAAIILAVIAAYAAALAFALWLGVRLSLAGPMTFAERRVRLFASWGLTRRRFWSLFGCYLLAFVFLTIISLVSLTIYGAISTVATGSITEAAKSIFTPDLSSVKAYLSPARVAYLVFSGFLGAIYYAVGVAPAAAAYRALVPVNPQNQAEVFD